MDGFYQALGDIAACVHASDDDMLGDYTLTTPRGYHRGWIIGHNGAKVTVEAAPSDRYFTVEYAYRFSRQFNSDFSQADIQRAADGSDTTDLETARENLVKRSVRNLDPESRSEAYEATQEVLDTLDLRAYVPRFDDGTPDGIVVHTRLYPYSDDFDLAAYDSAMDQIARDGPEVARILHNSIPEFDEDTDPALDNADAMEEDVGPTRGLH